MQLLFVYTRLLPIMMCQINCNIFRLYFRCSSVRARDDKSIQEIHWNSRSASQYSYISNLSRPQFFTCDAGSGKVLQINV